MKSKILGLLAVGMLGLPVAANAVTTPITGEISLLGNFDCGDTCFAPGSASIVSQLNVLDSDEPAGAFGGVGDFAGSSGVVTPVATINLGAVPPGGQPLYTFVGETRFFAQGLANLVRTPLACADTSCFDALTFSLIGEVTRAGFDATPATVRWVGQGSCTRSSATAPVVCSSTPTASWSARLSSPTVTGVPEPGTLALLGLGLAGLGLSRRRKAN